MGARLRRLLGIWLGGCCLAVLAAGSAGATSSSVSVEHSRATAATSSALGDLGAAQLFSLGSVALSPDGADAGPSAGNVSFTGAVGNTAFGVGTTPAQPSTSTTGTVLSNSSGGVGPLTVASGPITTTGGGHVQMNADGTFTYVSAPGFTGTDTFPFTVSDGTSTASATASITVAGLVWYVNDAGSNGNGTSTSPFNALSGAAAASPAGNAIFLFGSATAYGGGITLKAGQSLIGQSATLVVGGQILSGATGSNPVVTNSAGTGIALGEGDTVGGVTVNGTSGAGITATSVNAFTLSPGDMITNAGANGLGVSGGNGTIIDGASISGAAGHSVSITNRSGGTFTLSGAINDTGSGILLLSNPGATIAFSGAITASTGANEAFAATGGGTITVSGAADTLTTTTATALDVENTSIGASGLTFQSISAGTAAAGPEHGIYLTGTGAAGGLTVTGTGSAGTGGTIFNSKSSGSPGSDDNAAVDLGTNTQDSTTAAPIGPVSLTDMAITAASNGGANGVFATNVARFTFANGSVTGEPEAGIQLSGFGSSAGTFSITGNMLSGQGGTPIDVTYPEGGSGTTTTAADSGVIANNTIGTSTTNSGSGDGGDGIAASEQGTGSLVVDIAGNHVSQVAEGYGIDADTTLTGSIDVTLTSNNVQQTSSQSLDGITVDSGENGSAVCMNAAIVATANTSHAVNTNFEGLGFDAVGLSVVENSTIPSFSIQGYSGPTDDAGQQVEALLNSTNTLSGPHAGDGSIAVNNAGALFFTGTGTGLHSTCPTVVPQTITFNAPTGKTYGQADFNPGAAASSLLGVYYTNPVGQCTLDGSSEIHMTGAGLCTVTANQDGVTAGTALGSVGYQPATAVTQTFLIAKAQLMVNANPAQQAFGAAQAPLTYTLGGFVSPDNATNSSITGAGSCSLAPGTGPGVGVYPGAISCVPGTLAAPNYAFAAGSTATYTITGATQTIAKSFGAPSIPLNGSTSLSFTITNPVGNGTATGVAFSDVLPSGLVVATPNGLSGPCGGGTITAVAGSGTVSLSGATLADGASCTFSVTVTGTSAGVKNNAVTVSSTSEGTGNTATASLTVVAPPGLSKAFGASSIPLNGSTSLSFTVANANATSSLSGVGFSDTLPSGLVVSTPDGLSGTCGGGTISAAAGASTVSLAGATLAAGANCTFSVNVTGTAAGSQVNTTGAPTSNQGGSGAPASATLVVVAPPVIAKAFGASSVPLNGTTSLTFTLTNPAANTAPEQNVGFTDNFPAGLVVATPSGSATTCADANITDNAGSSQVTAQGILIPVGGSCTISLNVTATASGSLVNSVTISSSNGGTGNTAMATLNGSQPQTITFNAPSGVTYGQADFSPGATASSGLAVTYTNASGQCTIDSGGLLVHATGAGSCTVTANQAGNTNYQAATPVTQTFSIAKATLTVDANPAQQAFGAAQAPLTYTLHGFVSPDNATNSGITGSGTCSLAPGTGPGAGVYPATISCLPGTLAAPNYTFVPGATATYTITAASQTITFNAPSGVTYGQADFSPGATASSGLAVTYTNAAGQCTIDSGGLLVHATGAGSCTVTANQAGNANYQAATPVTQTFSIAKATLTVDANPAQQVFGAAQAPLTYTLHGFVSPDNATNSGITGSGTCSLAPGTGPHAGTYTAAISCVPATLAAPNYTFVGGTNATYTITAAPQTITITSTPPNPIFVGSSYTVVASASSTLPVSVSLDPASTAGACTLTGATVAAQHEGTCIIDVAQGGNNDFQPAPTKQQTLIVDPVVKTTASLTPAPVNGYYQDPTVTLSATDTGGTLGQTNYQIDGGTVQKYTVPFVISPDGPHTLSYWSTDQGGYTEPTNTLTVKVDTTPPTTTASVSPTPVGGAVSGPATITLTAVDGFSGVASTQYALDGGAFQTYTAPIVISAGGAHTLQYRSTDVAGNVEVTKTLNIQVNPTAGTTVQAQVPSTLAVSVGSQAPSLGAFAPGVGATYTGTLAMTVTSSAQNATLTAADLTGTFTGHLVNNATGGPYALVQGLQVSGSDPANNAGSGIFSDLSVSEPATLLTYAAAVGSDPVTITFKQTIGVNEPLRTGNYSKTITFTLSTSNP